MDFKESITKRRKAKGWTQERLAAEAGISKGGLSDIMNGKTQVCLPRLIKIAKALNVSVWRMVKEAEKS